MVDSKSLQGQVVCYLDFDGTVHFQDVFVHPKRGIYMASNRHRLFEWSELLEQLLAPYPDVRIVLSTSWVPMCGFLFAKRQLPQNLQSRVIGATFHTRGIPKHEFLQLPRGVQIAADVERRKPSAWFAIDDDDFGWPVWCREKLVLVDGRTGLSSEVAQHAVAEQLQRVSEQFK